MLARITGSGTTFNPTWNGKNDLGVLQPDGTYSYSFQARSSQGTATPATGTLFVDSRLSVVLTSPSSGQTLSNVYANGVTDVPIIGTVNITGLVGWQLYSGVGGAPSTWTLLGSGTQGVTNGTLATWATLSVDNQLYTLWLVAWDAAGYYSQVTSTVTVANFRVSESVLQFNPPTTTVTYSSILPFTLTETLVVKNAAGQVVRTLVNGAPRTANTYNDVWDGKSDSLGFLPDGPYFYVATVTDGTHYLTWDLTNQYLNDWSNFQNLSPSDLDPFNNRPMQFGYQFDRPGLVSIVLSPTCWSDYYTCTFPYVCLKSDKYEESAVQYIYWAGVDSTGALRTDLCWMFVFSRRTTFSKNAIVLFGTKPSVTNVKVNPAVYGPAVGTQAVKFDLATFQAQLVTVTVTFLNQESLSVLRTITLTGQSPGQNKTVTWDGHGDNGMWVAPGYYTVTVSATDPLGNQAQGQILTTIEY